MKILELDVPHWAAAMIGNYRSSQNLPPEVTDRMIFGRLQQCGGMDLDDIEDLVGQLRQDITERTTS